ncbi:trypsin-like serine protease [Microbacterium sp. M3]|uniref:Trypsin-like serine protease n=1 Tax=Microbacterium arthrosphaerae TaxID=792652 RepID=A0ABU4H528_9MICO|nr:MULTISPECIES: trypsin-like serine protease [Microbacterium]MDW4574437.1 trypsin-like serine protease [Microbacterium arthrosphaerae]MDW7608292.1 trypsin-like serine protease [Microbacterium sp. M3]
MRRVLVFLLALVLVGATAATASAITFGEPDGELHPNVGVVVIDRNPGSPGPDITCSGTLIAERVFLTVAHCVDVLLSVGEPYFVSFDSTYDEDDPAPAGLFAGTATQHPSWGSSGHSNTYDMAVIVLDSAPGITPAELPTAGLLDQLNAAGGLRDQTFTTVGYGVVRTDKTGGPRSWEGRDGVRRYALQGFQSLRPSSLELSQNPSTGDGGICAGDSGGPHFLGGVDSNLVVSTTVRTDRWCRATNETYRLDTASARAFLGDYVDLP